MLEFIKGIFGNLVSGWLVAGGNFLLTQATTGSIEWQAWKAKYHLTDSDNDFLIRFAEALVATLDTEEKRKHFGPFFENAHTIQLFCDRWYGKMAPETFQQQIKDQAGRFMLSEADQTEINRFSDLLGTVVHDSRSAAAAQHFELDKDTNKEVREIKELLQSRHTGDSAAEAPRADFGGIHRKLLGPNDPMLDPWLGKPLHGREREVAEIADLLAQGRSDLQVLHPVVLSEGGVGKTEVCKAALRRFMNLHPHKNVWFVNLEGANDLGALRQRMGEALGADEIRGEADLLRRLEEGVYYLDNLEGLAELPEMADALRRISQTPGVCLLASSRREVPGWGQRYELDTLPLPAAEALFREVWTDGGAQPLADPAPGLQSFLERDLGCLPLAVVLVAALGRFESSLEAVLRRWREEGAAMAKRPGAGDTRLDSLEQSIRLSLHGLDAEARLLWAMAAFFPACLPADAFDHLLGARPALREGRNALLLRRILHRQVDGRMRLSPPLARFARDAMAAREQGFEAGACFELLAPWFGALGAAADQDQSGDHIARLLAEFPSMEEFTLFFVQQQPIPAAYMAMLRSWENFYNRRAEMSRNLFRIVLKQGRSLEETDQGWIMRNLGDLERLMSENEKARDLYQKALPLYEKVGDGLGKANTLKSLGILEFFALQNPAEAAKHWSLAVELYQKVGDTMGLGFTVVRLALLEHSTGNQDAAPAHWQKA